MKDNIIAAQKTRQDSGKCEVKETRKEKKKKSTQKSERKKIEKNQQSLSLNLGTLQIYTALKGATDNLAKYCGRCNLY